MPHTWVLRLTRLTYLILILIVSSCVRPAGASGDGIGNMVSPCRIKCMSNAVPLPPNPTPDQIKFRLSPEREYLCRLAVAMYDSGDMASALKDFLELAEADFAPAQCRLATMYLEGRGSSRDFSAAAGWMAKAAGHGIVFSQYMYARMLANGIGVPRSDDEAALWMRRAAESGFSDAAVGLAQLYAAGRGVPKDRSLAAEWFRKAAERGDTFAQAELADLLIETDRTAAIGWYRKAAEGGDVPAQRKLGLALREESTVEGERGH